MSAFPGAARPVRGGFVLWDNDRRRVRQTIPFQYNPDTLTRTLQPQGIGNEPGDRLEALRLKGPPHESYKFDAEFDATETPEKYPDGLVPVLAALELTVYPTLADLEEENRLAGQGQFEIAPVEAPLLVLVLGVKRVLPVRITDLSITEDAFDAALNPIRAKVSVGVRVLTVDDVGFVHKAGDLYRAHHGNKEGYALGVANSVTALGIPSI